MARLAILFGGILILLGLGAYAVPWLQTGAPTSPTALIPAAIGLLLSGSGLLAAKMSSPKLGMHLAALIALLALGATSRGIMEAIAWAGGTVPERQTAVIIQSITGVLCAVFLGLAILSFVVARRGSSKNG